MVHVFVQGQFIKTATEVNEFAFAKKINYSVAFYSVFVVDDFFPLFQLRVLRIYDFFGVPMFEILYDYPDNQIVTKVQTHEIIKLNYRIYIYAL